LDGAVDTDHHLGQDGELVLDRADAVEDALELAGEEVDGDFGHRRDLAVNADGCLTRRA
jgi:hypothetical protein